MSNYSSFSLQPSNKTNSVNTLTSNNDTLSVQLKKQKAEAELNKGLEQLNNEIDSLKKVLQQSQHDTSRIVILNHLSNIAPDGEWEQYNAQAKKIAISNSKTTDKKLKKFYFRFLSTAYNNEGLYYKIKGDAKKAIKCYEKSLEIARKYDDSYNAVTTLVNLGRIQYDQSDVWQALRLFSEAFDVYEKKSSPPLTLTIAYAMNFVGEIYKDQKDYKKSFFYYNKALNEFKKINDKQGIATSYSYMAAALLDQKKYNDALDYFVKSMKMLEEVGDMRALASTYNNIGLLLQNKGNIEESFTYLHKSLKMFRYEENKVGIHTVFKNLGSSHFLKNNDDSALFYYNSSMNLAKELGYPKNIEVSAKGLYEVYKKKGELTKALEFHELYIKMRDSVNLSNNQRNTIASQFKYEYDRKQFSDSVKIAGEKQLIQSKLEQTQTRMYLYFACAVLAALIAFLLIQRLRFSQKVKELKMRNKIAIDLHDEVGSALSSISMYAGVARLQEDKKNSVELLGKIESTSRETLGNMSDIVWSLLPRNDKFSELLTRMKKINDDYFAILGIDFVFEVEKDVEKLNLSMNQRQNLYLIYKEAINNIAKYAQATSVQVKMMLQGRKMFMQIKDNGCGFESQAKTMGNGIFAMKNRAAEMKGSLDVQSIPGMGTTIVLLFKPN